MKYLYDMNFFIHLFMQSLFFMESLCKNDSKRLLLLLFLLITQMSH